MVYQGEQEKADETKDRPWQYGKDTPYYSEKDKNGPTDNRNGLEQGLSASIYFLTSSISTKMSTSSPTTTPPVSSALFHARHSTNIKRMEKNEPVYFLFTSS